MTDTTPTFDLVTNQWILVQDRDGSERMISLMELFELAPTLRRIGGEVPTQTFALTRLLLAIIRRAVDWGDAPIDRWAEIWRTGAFPTTTIADYLHRYRHRFDLLDVNEPFYQVADLATAKGGYKPVELLLVDVPTGEKYFTTRAGSGAESLDYAEAARWLVHCQAYDISGIKSADPRDPRGNGGKGYPIGVAWCGQIGGLVFEGDNVFQTLMLNTVVIDSDENTPAEDDLPTWERPHPDYRERELPIPNGPADLLTWQSRRIRLQAVGGRVRGVLVANGDPLASHNKQRFEFMTGWRYSEPQSKKFGDDRYLPMQWNSDRSLWRGIQSLLADVPEVTGARLRTEASGVAHWLAVLVDTGVVDSDLGVRPHAYGLTYINQASVVGASVDDSLLTSIALLGRHSNARLLADRAVVCADEAVRILGVLALRLVRAAGGAGDGGRRATEAEAYFALDCEFAHWLKRIGAVDDPERDWEVTVQGIVEAAGNELIANAGENAWRGRENEGQWGDFKGDWLDSAIAGSMFRLGLRRAIPRAYEREPATMGGIE